MNDRFTRTFFFVLVGGLMSGSFFTALGSQEKPAGPPPALVTVSTVEAGRVAPQAEFIGTVFYEEVSDVASELSGLVETVHFEDGQRVKKGQALIELRSDLLDKRRRATSAAYQQVLTELEIASIELERREKLFKTKSISEQSYDENRFRVKGIENRAASLKAEVERFELELQKKIIRAPFDGVVIRRVVDRGEWISEGATVAVLAKDDVVDIVANVPEKYLPHLRVGMPIKGTVNGNEITGSIIALVPRADVATRTFPVKIRTANSSALIEGMSASVTLPTGESVETLVVPRDAVVRLSGQTVVYVVSESKARMIPVSVIGYRERTAGVAGQGLAAGMQVVVKGNERLSDGQMVSLTGQK